MMNDAAEGCGNCVEQGPQVELGNYGVVDLQQHAQTVALLRQLPLVSLGALAIERVVHRNGHLPRPLLYERDFTVAVMVGRAAAEAEHAQTSLGGRQWDRACRLH